MLDNFYLEVDFDEDIFDRVNSLYTKEYEADVEKADQLLSTLSTLNKVGGASNYARLLSSKDTYNISREKSATEAAKIREAVRQRTFVLGLSENFTSFPKLSMVLQRIYGRKATRKTYCIL